MEIVGKIRKIEEIQVITDTFKKRSFWLDTFDNPSYPQVLEITLIQKGVDLIDTTPKSRYKVGDEVKLQINLKGRLIPAQNGKPDKVFNAIEAWRIELANSSEKSANSNKETKKPVQETDEVPF